MKYHRTICISIVASILFTGCSASAESDSNDKVFICVTGKVYHNTRSCRGLRKAIHEIKAVTESDAINTYGRRECRVCY